MNDARQAPTDAVARQVEHRIEDPGTRLLNGIVAQLGGEASAAAVYGDPIERGGVTVIPVARIGFGFGGGGGKEDGAGNRRDGSGGGGGASAVPVGYIEIRDGEAVFKPIRTPAKEIVIPLALITGMTVVRIVATAMKRRKKR